MGEGAPFSEEEQAAIGRVAYSMVRGEQTTGPLRSETASWGGIVQLLLSVINGDNGSMHALPYDGGFMEQPWRTMQVFAIVQGALREKLSDDMTSVRSRRR